MKAEYTTGALKYDSFLFLKIWATFNGSFLFLSVQKGYLQDIGITR